MNSDRIKEIQETTAYPESVSVKQALLQVWNECAQEKSNNLSTNLLKKLEIANEIDYLALDSMDEWEPREKLNKIRLLCIELKELLQLNQYENKS